MKTKQTHHIVRRWSYRERITRNLNQLGLGVLLVLIFLAVFSYTRAGIYTRTYTRVSAATSSTLNFQARLLNASGSIVADGNYSVQFNLYSVSSGGTTQWTETQTVAVKSGYLSAYLGSNTPFPGSIDWSQEQWLTMNVQGDGEMTPRLKLTAVPYAFRAAQADGITNGSGVLGADDILQKAPTSVQSLSSTLPGLRLNQTGSGGLLQLQGNGSDVFTVDKTGATTVSGQFLGKNSSDSSNAFRVQNSAGNNFLTVDTLGSTLALGNTGIASTIQVGNSTGAVAQTISIGANATGGSSTALTMGSLTGVSSTTIQGGTGGVQITSGANVNIGSSDTTGTLLVVDTKTNAGDPTGTNGAIYYNSFAGKFRCYENGAWNDCISGASSSTSANFVSGLQNVPTNTSGAVVETMLFTSATAVSNTAGVTGFTAPAAGSFRSCMIKNTAAITAGTLSLRWRVNGASVGSGACVMDSTNNRQTSDALNSNVVTFAAGDTIGIAFDTSAGFLPSGTNDFTVYWGVEYTGGGGGGGGGNFDLQDAYDNSISASILSANNKDIEIDLADTAIDSNFIVNIQSGSTGEFKIQNNGTDALTINKDGDIFTSGALTVGNTASSVAGTIRWTGLDFEGFDGASWVSLTSGGGGAGLGSNYVNVVKQTNEVVNNSIALQDDDELQFSIGPNEEWTYRFVVQGRAATAADFRFAVGAPGGATCFASFSDPEGGTSEGQYGCGTTSISIPGNAATDLYEITGSVKNGPTAGTVSLRWAQFTLNASDATVYAGSYLNAFRSIGSGGAGQPFVQNGNSFGAKAVLGTSDNNDLGIITNNNERITVLANGNVGIGDTTPAALFTVGTSDALQINSSGNLSTSGTVQVGGLTTLSGNLVGAGSATLTTATAAASPGTNTTTVALTGSAFANNDVIYIDNAGQDYYTRIVSGGGTATLTVSPAVSYDASATITKYNVQNIGATATDYTTQANRFFQGYFLGGVVTGAGSTTLSDGNLFSTGDLVLQRNGGAVTFGGDVTVTGAITGDGSGLTSIDGAAISGGSIADGSLSSNVALLSGLQTFTGQKTFSAGLVVSASGASISGGIDNNAGGVTNAGAVSGVTSLTLSGAISGGTTVTGTTLNGTTGVNTGAGAGTQRIDNTGNLVNIGGLTLSGAISGGTTISGSGNINTTGGDIQTNSVTRLDNGGNLTNIGGLTLSGAISGGTTITGTTLNGTTGVNTGAGAGTQRIDNTGNLVNISGLSLSGAISGGTTYSGSGDINTTGGVIQTNSVTRLDNSGNLSNIGSLTLSGAISGGTTITGTTLNGTTGVNTGAGAGTQRIDNSGNLVNIAGLTLSGAISGGTTISGSGNINSTGGTLQTNSTTRVDNSGNLVNIGNLTATGALTISSGGSSDLTLNSASNTLAIDSTDTVLRRVAAGGFTINLEDAANTTLSLNNAGAGAALLNLTDGALQTGGTTRLSNGGALQNITGLNSSGTITFSGLSAGGLVKADGSGNLGLAVSGTDYELPLTFGNGLTRTTNTINIGGALTANRDIALGSNTFSFSGAGNVAIGNTTASGKFSIDDATTSSSLFINKTGASGDVLTLQKNGSDVFSIFNDGAVQMNSTSTAALQVRNAGGTLSYLTVNTSGAIVQIGSATGDGTGVLFVLDTKNTAGDPTGVAGAQYYNSNVNKFRCFENAAWKDCITPDPNTEIFEDLTAAAFAGDNQTTQIFNDATKPNITTKLTTSRVMINVHVSGVSNTNNDAFFAVRVVYTTNGVDPSCSTSTQVGRSMISGFTTANTHPYQMAGSFVHNPGVAGVIKYTVCSSDDATGTLTDTPDNVTVSLVELGS